MGVSWECCSRELATRERDMAHAVAKRRVATTEAVLAVAEAELGALTGDTKHD